MYNKDNIYYEIKNSNKEKTLVLLHGNGEDHHIYDEFINYFNDYKIILIDTRLHGKSSKKKGKVTLDLICDDVIDILSINNVKEAYFVGFSDGGNILLLLALKRGDLVKRMVLMGANYNQLGLKWNYLFMNYLWYGLYGFLGLFNSKFKLKRRITRLMTLEPNLKDEDLKKISTDTLIITSKKDCIRLKHSLKMKQLINHSKLAIISHSSHYFLKDNLKDTISEISAYFIL